MENVCNKTHQEIKLKFPDLKLFFLARFFDYVGVATHSEFEYIKDLEGFSKSAKKLNYEKSKCDFPTKQMDYLGFQIDAQSHPSPLKFQAILKAKIHHLKDLRSFLDAANSYRRHIHNFIFFSAP